MIKNLLLAWALLVIAIWLLIKGSPRSEDDPSAPVARHRHPENKRRRFNQEVTFAGITFMLDDSLEDAINQGE